MNNYHLLVSESGALNEAYLHSREPIYTGRNGKAVERIVASVDGVRQSLIFKPLTNYDTIGREEWANRHIVPHLTTIRVPRLFGVSEHADPERYWLLMEDMGKLEHQFHEPTLILAAKAAPYWHLLPAQLLPSSFAGHSPHLEAVWHFLMKEEDSVLELLRALGMPDARIGAVGSMLRNADIRGLASEIVISHGDLYPLNVVSRDRELIVLDWEYIHLNSVYWDLYNLIDMTSPSYRRKVVGRKARSAILGSYAAERQKLGKPVSADFFDGYHVYCAMFSMWILYLIDADLKSQRFAEDALAAQGAETLQILNEMLVVLADSAETG